MNGKYKVPHFDGKGESDQYFIDAGIPVILKVGLTKENHREVLTPLLTGGPGRGMIVNLSVDTSSADLMDFCKDIDALYIDTVAEPWPGFYTTPSSRFRSARTTRCARACSMCAGAGPAASTAMTCCGANPGMVSWFVKQALLDIARDTGVSRRAEDPRGMGAADAARSASRASTSPSATPSAPASPSRAACSSTPGRSRASARRACSRPSSAGARTRRGCRRTAIATTSAAGAAIYLTQPGAGTRVRSWTPTAQAQHGFLVTHNESISIADYFTRARGRQGRSTGRPATTPITPATTPCCRCTRWPATPGSASRSGKSSTRTRSWTASTSSACCSTATPRTPTGTAPRSRSRRRGSSRPTRTPPACRSPPRCSPASSGCWRTRSRGITEADEMDFRRCLEIQLPYLGKVFGTYTDWTPLAGRPGCSRRSSTRAIRGSSERAGDDEPPQPRSITPASPASVPNASSVPAASQPSAVTGPSPGFLPSTSAPSSIRTSSTVPSA